MITADTWAPLMLNVNSKKLINIADGYSVEIHSSDILRINNNNIRLYHEFGIRSVL